MTRGDGKEETMAVAIDKDKGSQHALKWAVVKMADNKLSVVVFLTLMFLSATQAQQYAPAEYGSSIDTLSPIDKALLDDKPQADYGTVADKLSPLDKGLLDEQAVREHSSPEEQRQNAEFLYKMKTGAPLDPEQQERADQLWPISVTFYTKELPKYNDVPVEEAINQLKKDGQLTRL